jgi:hyperosmotically inducible periplasmic protein
MRTIERRKVLGPAGVLLGALAFAAPAFADDAGLRERIEARMNKAGLADDGQIAVDVTADRAVLSGFTTTVAAREQAEKAARKETKNVDNRLQVVPAVAMADADVQQLVGNAILGYEYYGVFDSVGVSVDNGVVTLQGSVLQPWRKDEIARRVSRVEGVREVKDQIRVQPPSPMDDRLRRQLYARIYGGPLERFAGTLDPPVHIVVENGNITLTGVVNSRVEKVQLESIARGTLAFRVDNQVQVENEIDKEGTKKS